MPVPARRLRSLRLRSLRTVPLLAALALGGCHLARTQHSEPLDMIQNHTYFHLDWIEKRPLIRSQAEPITVVHEIPFAGASVQLSDEAGARLIQFLRDNGAYEGARVEIDGPRLSGGQHDAMTAARIAALRQALTREGLSGEVPTHPVTLLTKPDDRVTVTVTRAMAILPDCANRQPAGSARIDYAWSCSNAASLGLMVADPLDLERGRALGPADGQASAQGVQRYRTDKVKPLMKETTSSN